MVKTKTKDKVDAAAGIDPAKDHIGVRSIAPKGHLRAGMRHTSQVKVHAPGTFDGDQLKALAGDPRILITKVDPPADDAKVES